MQRSVLAMVPLLAFWGSVACDDQHSSHSQGGHGVGEHIHVAPHGGVLLPLGEHAFNIEFVLDRALGSLDLYILDGHAENFLRLPTASLSAQLNRGQSTQPFVFTAIASSQTGEKVGDTSHFQAQSDWLKESGSIQADMAPFEIRGQRFQGQRVELGR